MHDFLYDKLVPLGGFKGLKRKQKVYSKKYGLGQIVSVNRYDEIIVDFPHLTKRISADEEEICIIPDQYLKKQSAWVEVNIDGKSMSFAEFKRRNILKRKFIRKLEKIENE